VLWGIDSLPTTRQPDTILAVAPDADGLGPAVARHELVTRMPHGIASRAAWIRSRANAPCLMVYHQGHEGDFTMGAPVIRRLLAGGCDVLALALPLYGRNPTPTITDSTFGTVRLSEHTHLVIVDRPDYPIPRYFMEPLVASLNWVLARHAYARVGMVGISGGGWATAVYSALDPRITRSYPVAGSEPLFVWARRPGAWADAEQIYMPLLRAASFEEMYVLASTAGRRQLAVYNRFDPCCFSGEYSRLYAPAVASVARALGGSYRVFLDESHANHIISRVALDSIVADFAR
jgi:pimeloyl-ACP methyl ester carboxylesterase